MSSHLYILDENQKPVREPDIYKWARWYEKSNRHVGLHVFEGTVHGEVRVSTVFLGLDHNDNREGPPILWETMVFYVNGTDDDGMDQDMDRCAGNWEQAQAMHMKMVKKVEDLLHIPHE